LIKFFVARFLLCFRGQSSTLRPPFSISGVDIRNKS
jgi:hypothetical protein